MPAPRVKKFTEHDMNVDPKSVVTTKELGRGNFSRVYLGTYQGRKVAVKMQQLEFTEMLRYLLNELAILNHLKHPGCIAFYGAYKVQDMAHVLTEYLEGGDLRRLTSDSSTPLGWKFRTEVALGCAHALTHLHTLEIIHRDIKTENVLLTAKGEPKLCDFGFARQWDKSKTMTMCGTDEFMAPEIIFGTQYDEKVDVYSYGIMLAEVLVRKQPGKNSRFLDRGPAGGFQVEHEELEKECTAVNAPNSLVLLVKECCAPEAENRLAAVDVGRWLEDLLKEIEPDTAPAPLLGSEVIKEKLEQYIKKSVMDEAKMEEDEDKPSSTAAAQQGRVEAALTERSIALDPHHHGDKDKNGGAAGGDGSANAGGFSLLGCFGIGGSSGKVKRAGDKSLRMQGWVTKRGGRIKTWKKRYMVITNIGIVYFKAPDDKEEQGAITFDEMTTVAGVVANAVPTVMTGKPNTFGVHTENRTYYISAQNVEERGKWIRAISDGYRAYIERGGDKGEKKTTTKRKGSD